MKRNKDQHYREPNHLAMLQNYLRVGFRSLKKNKVYASINILGLAVGLASCLAIFFFVKKEFSYDQFHTKVDRIYRVTNVFERASGTIFWARTPPALAPGIRNGISGIENVTRLRYADEHTYAVGERIFNQGNVFYADSVFLQLFDFELVAGDSRTALNDPNTIVITEEMATKYFGQQDPMGQLITFDNDQSLLVTGVLASIPDNSHITFDMLISFETYEVPDGYLADLNSWGWAGFHTYALLTPGSNPNLINDQIVALYNQNINRANIKTSTELQPLATIYLDSGKYTNVGESISTGSESTIYGLTIIATLILVIAGFNFTNLSTALSLGRGKEIGIRKVMGAPKGKVAFQFLVESVMVSFMSLALAIAIIALSSGYFKQWFGIDLPSLKEYLFLVPLFVLSTLLIGLVAGAYPSAVLSAFSPIRALRGSLKLGKTGSIVRSSLTVFQFVISLSLIAGSIVIVTQVEYLNNKHLGFEKENILQIKVLREDMAEHYASLKNSFQQHSLVLSVAMTSHCMDGGSSSGPANLVGSPEDQSYQLAYYQTDHDFLDLTGIELVDGRYFSKNFLSDSTAMLLNETAVGLLDLSDPIGTKINFTNAERTVIGVVKDFHFNSLHTDIAPMAIVMPFTNTERMLVRISGGEVRSTLAQLEADWKSIVGSSPFEVTFLDDNIQSMYEQEEKLAGLLKLFSALAVILASLGLYGLVAFSVQAKLKEVGIRKVLGSSLSGLLWVLSRQFMILISIATAVSVPLIHYFGNNWLESYAYRINIEWWVYAAAGILLLLIAIVTISHQTIKAALTNPVKVLRNE
ncbi:MAG: ABC transporter permease [Bacteroidota bacterium]